MIQWLGALPATYGYYAADDEVISPGEQGGLTQYVSEIKALDANAMVMVGSAVSQGTTYASTGATLGTEIYPETSGNLMPVSQQPVDLGRDPAERHAGPARRESVRHAVGVHPAGLHIRGQPHRR